MKKNKDDSFSVKINIDLGKSYQFGYSIDGRWNTDADLPVVASPFGTSNSVLDLTKVAPVEEAPKAETKSVPKTAEKKSSTGKKAAK
jgi:hypothetical protein